MGVGVVEKTRAEELHDEYRRKIWDDLKTSSENFDKYMLTFSSGAFGLSLGFIENVVKPETAVSLGWLVASWISFLLCILITLISFRVSIKALERMGPCVDEFYLKRNADAFNAHLNSYWTKAVDWCAYAAIVFFVSALACTMVFVQRNFHKEHIVSKQNAVQKPATGDLQRGLKPVGMTDYTADGVKSVAVTPVSSNNTTAQPASSAQSSSSTTSSASENSAKP